jgi:hypothetical protein
VRVALDHHRRARAGLRHIDEHFARALGQVMQRMKRDAHKQGCEHTFTCLYTKLF